ncbi:hypothetical protein D1007_52103 [Hordeum vulgare]|nr:hypothetical protein D1007_52103 [Hordeum vulgare]
MFHFRCEYISSSSNQAEVDPAYELDDLVCFRQIYEEEGGLINKFYHINLTAKTKGDDGFHSGVDNLFFGEVTRIEGKNEEYMLNCLCMVKPIDNGCTKYGEYDLKHPDDADKYKGGHSTPFMQCRGMNHIPFLDPDVPVYIRSKQDWLEAEKAMLAKKEAKIRFIYECPGDSPIQAKLDGARMPAGLAKGGDGAGLAKGGVDAGLAKRGEGAGLAKRNDHQGSVKYIVPARRGLTADNLERRGWPNQGTCALCSLAPESCGHLFVHCSFTAEVWQRFRTWVGVPFPTPAADDKGTEDWWLRARNAAPERFKRDFDAVVILVYWRLWKERNARIFDGIASSPDRVVEAIIEDLRSWREAGCVATTIAF